MKNPRTLLLLLLIGAALTPSGVRAQGTLPNELYHKALRAHVTDDDVNFAGLKEDADLGAYLKALAEADLRQLIVTSPADATPEDQSRNRRYEHQRKVAFWINAYNALVLKRISDQYSEQLRSVRQIKDFYRAPAGTVAGKPRSLQEIEEGILLKELREPRAVFLLYRGFVEGPTVPRAPTTAVDLEDELQDGMRRYFLRSDLYHLDTLARTLTLADFFRPTQEVWGGEKEMVRALTPFFGKTRETKFAQVEEIAVKYRPTDTALHVRFVRKRKPVDK